MKPPILRQFQQLSRLLQNRGKGLLLLIFILTASATLAVSATAYGAYAHDWQWVVAGALLFGAILLPLAYDKLVVKVVRNGTEVTVDASRSEK
jgi:hypothetical protein